MCPLVALLSCEPRQATRIESDEFPPETMICDVPSWALDIYSREGRAALARFLETDAPAARWVRGEGQARAPGLLAWTYRLPGQGGLVVNRMRWPLAHELRRQVDVECSGPNCADATEILELTRADLPLINDARVAVISALGSRGPTRGLSS